MAATAALCFQNGGGDALLRLLWSEKVKVLRGQAADRAHVARRIPTAKEFRRKFRRNLSGAGETAALT